MTDSRPPSTPPDEPPRQHRDGPHPLALHVASTTQNWTGAAAAFSLFALGGGQIHPDLRRKAEELRQKIQPMDPLQLQLAVMQGAQERLSQTLAGITAYQQHAYQRDVAKAPLFQRIGTTEIRDYGKGLPDDAPVVLAVPSLVNPAYILDLMEDHSFVRYLAGQGVRPCLLDWTAPGDAELEFGLEDYILQRLIPLIRALHRHHGRKIHLLGYCMGGNLALAAAQILQPEDILHSLTLMATPWDFHADQPAHLKALIDSFLKSTALMDQATPVPMNLLQLFFFSLDPSLSDRKFRQFAALDPTGARARNFVALEDWANDGAPLSPRVAKDCLINWYRENQPHQGQWKIDGQVIDPARLHLPGHIITPQSDRIVPPASAKALQRVLPRLRHHATPGGHVTMIAGPAAKVTLWSKLALNLK